VSGSEAPVASAFNVGDGLALGLPAGHGRFVDPVGANVYSGLVDQRRTVRAVWLNLAELDIGAAFDQGAIRARTRDNYPDVNRRWTGKRLILHEYRTPSTGARSMMDT
jgi:hypothetical protein